MVALEAAGGPLPPLKPPPTIQSPSSLPQHPHYAIPKTSTSRRRIVRTNASTGTRPHVALHVQRSRDSRTPHHDASIIALTSTHSTPSVLSAALLNNQGQVINHKAQTNLQVHSTAYTFHTTQTTIHDITQQKEEVSTANQRTIHYSTSMSTRWRIVWNNQAAGH